MKRLIICIFIIGILVFICSFTAMTTAKITADLSHQLEEISENGISASNTERIEKLLSCWNGKRDMLYVFFEHENLSKIDDSLNLLPYFLETGDENGLYLKCQQALLDLNKISLIEKTTLSNIF